MKHQYERLFLAVALGMLLACNVVTVPVPTADATPPVVKMDIYGIVEPGAQYVAFGDCCTLRRTVGLKDELTIVASAADTDSGVSSLEIVGIGIRQCTVITTSSGSSKVPAGPPIGTMTLRQEERILASSVGAGTGSGLAPQTRLANVKTHLNDFRPEACPPIRALVSDEPPISVIVGQQSTTFCGTRVFARAKNGTGTAHSTATGLLVEGPPLSGAFPCASVPF